MNMKNLLISSIFVMVSFSSHAMTIENTGNYWEYLDIWVNPNKNSNGVCDNADCSDNPKDNCILVYSGDLNKKTKFTIPSIQSDRRTSCPITKARVYIKNKTFPNGEDYINQVDLNDNCIIKIYDDRPDLEFSNECNIK
jgi:hypothetical protein